MHQCGDLQVKSDQEINYSDQGVGQGVGKNIGWIDYNTQTKI